MKIAAPTITPGALLVGVGVLVGGILLVRASSKIGDALSNAADAINSGVNTVTHVIYPDSLLPSDQTVFGKLDDRYKGAEGFKDVFSRAWDGYWQDVGDFWGGIIGDDGGDKFTTDAQAINARNAYASTDPRRVDAGGASGSW